MKIAICVHNLANGGGERVAALLATGFAERGDDVTAVIVDKNARIEYAVSDKVQIVNIHAEGNAIQRYSRKLLKLRKYIRENKPDVAIAVMPPFDLWLLLATFGTKTKIVDTIHFSLERPKTNPISKQLYFNTFYLSRLFDAVTVLTKVDGEIMKRINKKCFVMPNPLAFESKQNYNLKEKVVLASGRLDGWSVKGFDVLIKAWGHVYNEFPDWRLQIAGRGDEKSKTFLLNLAKENGVVDRIDFLGFRPHIENDYRRASVFVMSSRTEGFSMVLIEAMSQGCACISCSYRGRQEEIITNENEGIICKTDDVEEMSRAIKTVLRDERCRRVLQEGAYMRSSEYSLEKTLNRWDELFCKIGLKI